MKIILASGSPRRKELLSLITSNFEIIISDAEETLQEGLTPEEQATRLSFLKAKEVYDKTQGNRIIIVTTPEVIQSAIARTLNLTPEYQHKILIKTGSLTQISYFQDWSSLIYSGYVPL